MCAVSNVGDYWGKKEPWQPVWPGIVPFPQSPARSTTIDDFVEVQKLKEQLKAANAEIAQLKAMAEKMKHELEVAKQEDIDNGTPDCEMEAKVAVIKLLAGALGVDVSKVFP